MCATNQNSIKQAKSAVRETYSVLHASTCNKMQLLFSNLKTFLLLNPTLHRHLVPLRTDLMDTRTALRFFFVSVFF